MASRRQGGWPSDPIIHHRKETVMTERPRNDDQVQQKTAAAEALNAALTGQGAAIICYAKCEPCQWGQHYDEPTTHRWAGFEDIEHAATTGQPEPTGNCSCSCGRAEAAS